MASPYSQDLWDRVISSVASGRTCRATVALFGVSGGQHSPFSSIDALTSILGASMMPSMRTTLTLDDDLAGLLKQRARELGIPFKEAVNRTIRAGMGKDTATRSHPAPKTISHSFGFRPGIDLDKLGQLADELEAEAFAEKIHDSARRKRSRSRAQR